jgi:hypothetical protein
MNHFTEYTIELYVLEAGLSDDQRREIESHLQVCHGCRLLADEMQVFYRKADSAFADFSLPVKKTGQALSRSSRQVVAARDEKMIPEMYRPATLAGRFREYISRHPVVSATGGFGALALCAVAAMLISRGSVSAPEPAYSHIDPERAAIDVYNRENKLLWSIPSNSVYHVGQDMYGILSSRVIVTDLHGDGRCEVITTLPVGDAVNVEAPATIFKSDGEVLATIMLDEKVQYGGTEYADIVGVRGLTCDNFSRGAGKEMIITSDNGRSPNVVCRFSAEGVNLGEYFHFGAVQTVAVSLPGIDYHQLAVYGENDTGDPDSLNYAILIFLDPVQLTGKTQAVESPGFGLPYSKAEREVIRFPLSDMNISLHTKSFVGNVQEIRFNDKSAFSVFVHGNGSDPLKVQSHIPIFEYILSTDMRVLAVKYDSGTLAYRNELVRQGKLKGTFDTAYLNRLKDGVLYWNGHDWQSRPVSSTSVR